MAIGFAGEQAGGGGGIDRLCAAFRKIEQRIQLRKARRRLGKRLRERHAATLQPLRDIGDQCAATISLDRAVGEVLARKDQVGGVLGLGGSTVGKIVGIRAVMLIGIDACPPNRRIRRNIGVKIGVAQRRPCVSARSPRLRQCLVGGDRTSRF